jgi:hypothetical protein
MVGAELALVRYLTVDEEQEALALAYIREELERYGFVHGSLLTFPTSESLEDDREREQRDHRELDRWRADCEWRREQREWLRKQREWRERRAERMTAVSR